MSDFVSSSMSCELMVIVKTMLTVKTSTGFHTPHRNFWDDLKDHLSLKYFEPSCRTQYLHIYLDGTAADWDIEGPLHRLRASQKIYQQQPVHRSPHYKPQLTADSIVAIQGHPIKSIVQGRLGTQICSLDPDFQRIFKSIQDGLLNPNSFDKDKDMLTLISRILILSPAQKAFEQTPDIDKFLTSIALILLHGPRHHEMYIIIQYILPRFLFGMSLTHVL